MCQLPGQTGSVLVSCCSPDSRYCGIAACTVAVVERGSQVAPLGYESTYRTGDRGVVSRTPRFVVTRTVKLVTINPGKVTVLVRHCTPPSQRNVYEMGADGVDPGMTMSTTNGPTG